MVHQVKNNLYLNYIIVKNKIDHINNDEVHTINIKVF